MRYHLKDNNEPGICIAKPGNCKKGNIEHFESKAEALAASEKKIQAEMEADGNTFGTTSAKNSAPIQKDSYIPELEPYSFSGENIAVEIEARGKTGFSCPRCGRQSSATEVSSMVNGGSASCSCGNELTVATANFSADHGSNRSSVSKDTKFFHASIVPIDEVIHESKALRSQWINDQERKGMKSSEAVQKGTRMSAVLSEMGTTPQYAIDGMLADDAVGDGFYVYEIEANEAKPGFYSLGGDDSSVDFEDPTGEAERLRAETGNHRGGYSFGSRYKDPGSTGFAADISTMTIRSKRWVSAEEAAKSPSVYNL